MIVIVVALGIALFIGMAKLINTLATRAVY